MICISFETVMYHSVLKVKKSSFLKLNSAYMLCNLFTKSSDMLNKNTWGAKKCEANQKQHCK